MFVVALLIMSLVVVVVEYKGVEYKEFLSPGQTEVSAFFHNALRYLIASQTASTKRDDVSVPRSCKAGSRDSLGMMISCIAGPRI
jgi:hypothetical protein